MLEDHPFALPPAKLINLAKEVLAVGVHKSDKLGEDFVFSGGCAAAQQHMHNTLIPIPYTVPHTYTPAPCRQLEGMQLISFKFPIKTCSVRWWKSDCEVCRYESMWQYTDQEWQRHTCVVTASISP